MPANLPSWIVAEVLGLQEVVSVLLAKVTVRIVAVR
jgi:hypothetical protein